MTNTDTPGEGLDPKALEAAMEDLFGEYDINNNCEAWITPSWSGAKDDLASAIRAYLASLPSPPVIGSDTAGLPSDYAGLVSWLEEVTSCGCIEPERFDEAAEAIAALSRAPDEQRDPEHGGTWSDGGKVFDADPPKETPGKLEYFDGRLRDVVDASRLGWPRFQTPSPSAIHAGLAERLKGTASGLRRSVEQAKFGGDTTFVRVKSPDLLLADLDEAIAALSASPPQGEQT